MYHIHHQYSELRKLPATLQPDEVILHIDYAENWQCKDATKAVKAECAVHNFLQKSLEENLQTFDEDLDYRDNQEGLQSVSHLSGNRHSADAGRVRDAYKDFFSSEAGEVPCQYAIVNQGTY
ncbi:UNVERIFIED_CONTAM: hypothetical protein FKN15_038882 [Acipenser sinensis]